MPVDAHRELVFRMTGCRRGCGSLTFPSLPPYPAKRRLYCCPPAPPPRCVARQRMIARLARLSIIVAGEARHDVSLLLVVVLIQAGSEACVASGGAPSNSARAVRDDPYGHEEMTQTVSQGANGGRCVLDAERCRRDRVLPFVGLSVALGFGTADAHRRCRRCRRGPVAWR